MQNNNIDLNFNGKTYKTEAALKRAITIANKSQIKQTKVKIIKQRLELINYKQLLKKEQLQKN
jgi:hypothetical protein